MLASKFKNSNQFQSTLPITDEQLRNVAPSIFATEAHESRSERYAYIPTSTVLSALRKEGFQPFFVAQSKCRTPGKAEFTKHLLRLRHASQQNDAGEAHEVIIINSHDGSCQYQIIDGVLRFVCMNGMVCGEIFADVKVRHSGNVVANVVEASYEVLSHGAQVVEAIDGMKSVNLTSGEQELFAEAALTLRYPDARVIDGRTVAPITPRQANTPKRPEDRFRPDGSSDLWTSFNRLQENLVRGGQHGTNAAGQRRVQRAVTGIDNSTALNRAMWQLSEGMRKLKAA